MTVTVDPNTHEGWRLVERPAYGPEFCSVSLQRDDPEGFIDTTNHLQVFDPRVYISVGAVRRMWAFLGLSNPETDRLTAQLAASEQRVVELEAELDEMDRNFQAIDRLQRVGYKGQKKPGRKPNPETVEAA